MDTIGKPTGKTAEELGVTGTTIRNYVKHFSRFLSSNATRKTRKRFTPEDIRTLRTAKTLLDEGLTYEQVSEQLETSQPLTGDVFPEGEVPPQEPEPEPDYIPPEEPPAPGTAIQPLEWYEQFVQPVIDAKDETIDVLRKENAWLRLPWWKRYFREPPE